MPTELKFLNSREAREILSLINEQWGFDMYADGFLETFSIMKNHNDDVFILSKDIARVNNPRLRIDSAGMYFAEIKNGSIRLSMEGAQIVGKSATKNIIELSREECEDWMMGEDLPVDEKRAENISGYILVKYKNNFLGTGRLKEGKILNFVPKIRRIRDLN